MAKTKITNRSFFGHSGNTETDDFIDYDPDKTVDELQHGFRSCQLS